MKIYFIWNLFYFSFIFKTHFWSSKKSLLKTNNIILIFLISIIQNQFHRIGG